LCDANLTWGDANGNGLFESGEGGAVIACGDGKKK